MGMKVNGTSGLTFPDTTTLASAGQASVRAWVNFNGTGTVAIRAAYNVTSITDGGTGTYTVNFTTALPDANYSLTGTCNTFSTANNNRVLNPLGTPTTTSVGVVTTIASTVGLFDPDNVNVAIFR